jgi:hypothetical protein
MALLTTEQSEALASLSQQERIDVVLNVLIRRMERYNRRQAQEAALKIVEATSTKAEAVARLKLELDHAD